MSITTINPPTIPSSTNLNRFQYPKQYGNNGGVPQQRTSVNATLVSEYYSSQSLSFDYTSKDGDTVSFSMESVEYSKSIMEVSAQGNREDMQKLVDFIKDNFDQMRKDMIKGFLRSIGKEVPEDKKVDAAEDVEPLQIPEEWNAENTSQRIVDFAVSFADIFEGTDEEFLSTIKAAIEEGFKQARELLGELPDQVSSLVDETFELVMQKLDAWAEAREVADEEEVATAA